MFTSWTLIWGGMWLQAVKSWLSPHNIVRIVHAGSFDTHLAVAALTADLLTADRDTWRMRGSITTRQPAAKRYPPRSYALMMIPPTKPGVPGVLAFQLTLQGAC